MNEKLVFFLAIRSYILIRDSLGFSEFFETNKRRIF